MGGCALCWVGLGSVVVGLGSLVWWASVSVSGGCCVVVGGGGGGRGAKPSVGGCALGVGRYVFRGLGQDFAKMVHFRPSENLENNFRQHVVLLEYLPIRYCFVTFTYGRLQQREKSARRQGHPCLRFVHDFVSVVFNTRNSCGWRHFSTKRTAMRRLRGQNFSRGSQPLKYCFDLHRSRLYLENLVLAIP